MHILTINEMPSHNHAQGIISGGSIGGGLWGRVTDNQVQGGTAMATGNTGNGQAHNNLQPYITAYFWKRTA